MRYLITILTLLLTILGFSQINFGGINNDKAVLWKLDKQRDKDSTLLKLTAHIKPDFHIWDLDAGGDGTLISTSIEIMDTDAYKWISEQKPSLVNLDFVEGTLRWHEKKVTFFTKVPNDIVDNPDFMVKVNYQVCNHTMCYPPTDEELK